MAFDEVLAARIRTVLRPRPYEERRMFGGIVFMFQGSMCCGVAKDELMARVGAERYAEALARPGAKPMRFTGREMPGFVFVEPRGIERPEDLAWWVEAALAYVSKLEPGSKPRKARKAPAGEGKGTRKRTRPAGGGGGRRPPS